MSNVDPRLAGWVSQTSESLNKDEKQFGKREKRAKVTIERGKSKILRILKAPAQKKFYIVRAQHWGIPVGMNSKIPLSCTYRHAGEQCYFCQVTNDYFNSGDPTEKTIARQIKTKTTYICNAIDVKDPVNEDGSPKILLWYMTPNVYKDIKGTFDPDAGYGDITHPLTGRDIKVTLEKTGEENGQEFYKYVLKVGGSPKPLVDPPGLDYIDHLIDLEAEFPLSLYDYDTQKGIFEGKLDPGTGKARAALGGGGNRAALPSGDDDEFESMRGAKDKEAEKKSEDDFEDPPAPSSDGSGDDDWDDLEDDSEESSEESSESEETDSMKAIREKLKKAKQGK